MATIPPNYRMSEVLPIAKHELGHYIVARVLGFRTGSISITIFDFNGGHAGNSVIVPSQPLKCDESIMDYLERRVTVLYAGSLGQTLTKGIINNEEAIEIARKRGGKSDWDKARELVQLWRNLRYPEDLEEAEVQKRLTELDEKAWNRAAEILVVEQDLIEGIAERLAMDAKYLHRPATLTEEDLKQIPKLRERFG